MATSERKMNCSEDVSISASAPAKCLFPSSTADATSSHVRRPVPFSIGDIMKPDSPSRRKHRAHLYLMSRDHSRSPPTTSIPQCPPGVSSHPVPLPSEYSERLCSFGAIPQYHSISSLPVSPINVPSGLQLEHLLSGPRSSFHDHSPLLPFENHLQTPGNSINPHSSPFAAHGHFSHAAYRNVFVPLPWPAAVPQPVLSANHSKPELHPAVIPAHKTISPSSDTSDVSINVEATSPTGSTTSSGFGSNPSPTLSSARSSPSEGTSPGSRDTAVTVNHRTCYSQKQSRRLKEMFLENKYPDVEQIEQLSDELNLPFRRLKVWFQNRRAREKKSFYDGKMTAYPFPVQSTMLPPTVGYGYPMMHQSHYHPTSALPVMPAYPSNIISFPYQQ